MAAAPGGMSACVGTRPDPGRPVDVLGVLTWGAAVITGGMAARLCQGREACANLFACVVAGLLLGIGPDHVSVELGQGTMGAAAMRDAATAAARLWIPAPEPPERYHAARVILVFYVVVLL